MRSDIVSGAVFPDYSLPDHTDTIRSLREVRGRDLWRDQQAATSEARPDWHLSTPGLREVCEGGEWSPFDGWGRRAAAQQAEQGV